MNCPRCHAELPDVAHFCHVCGQDVRSDDLTRRRSFAAKPDEPVASFALVSTIMPQGAGERPRTYRIALTIALVVALVAAIFGALPIAILVAAFAIPIVYIVYLYDVNLWEDEPIQVTGLAFGLTGALATVFTILVMWLQTPSIPTTSLDGTDLGGGPSVWTFLLVALVVPIVGEVIREIGPVLLASRPEFDDLMDGLTFGVVSGVAYSCFDTIVRFWDLLIGGRVEADPGLWMSLIFLHGFVKPLILGTATGIACAEYSGLGRGYDGFTPRYYRGVVEAILANIGFWGGIYLFSFVSNPTTSVLLSTGWGLLILGILILRVRNVLHTGLLEASLERSARDGGIGSSDELQFCLRCEMPLLDRASFCTACGTAVRAQAKPHRSAVSVPMGADPGTGSAAAPVPASSGRAADGDVTPAPPRTPPGATGSAASTGDAENRFDDDEEGRA
ncbi:MAG TPA: PrsW family intramembrane metalloprotease [Microlunatus sp.]